MFGTSWSGDCEVELSGCAFPIPDSPFQMTLGLVNGYMGLLLARSLERMAPGTDPEGRG